MLMFEIHSSNPDWSILIKRHVTWALIQAYDLILSSVSDYDNNNTVVVDSC